ncbi:MAG: VCBS repeat-containing protein, partial [Balneolaceae bacterium]|nr:VCBS repeat-containing protein [Balneolaceae bacterium]
KLYRNTGKWTFEDITAEAGVAHEGYNSTGVVFADVDGDTDPDLLVTSLTAGNELYLNDGAGRFQLKENSGLGRSVGSNTMALADIDRDGDLDLYITNYKRKSARDIFSPGELAPSNTVKKQGDSTVIIPPYDQYFGIIQAEDRAYRNEYGARDELYLNDGSGRFQKVKNTQHRFLDRDGRPMGLQRDWGLTASFHDINGDRLPDLYVANDFWTPDRFWINRGDGVFALASRDMIRSMSLSAMGVDFSDINRDGTTDFFVTEMLSADHQLRLQQLSEEMDLADEVPQYNRNSMYLNRGDHTFAEISYYSRLHASEWSWATNFMDVDLDGYEDLVITTGHAYDYQDMDTQLELEQGGGAEMDGKQLLSYPPLELSNKIYRNNRDLTFTDKSGEWGFGEQDISHGLAVADFDNDGDPDLAINRLNRQVLLYENRTTRARIAVRLTGNSPNTRAVGARITLEGAGVPQTEEVAAGGTYVSGSDNTAYFAADTEQPNHTVTVTWPDGNRSIIDSVRANRIYEVRNPSNPGGVALPSNKAETAKEESPLFRDISDRLGHGYTEDPYTDTNIQPLLPAKLSEQGPGISWIDLDGDDDDDLVIPAGKGSETALFENDGRGRFARLNLSAFEEEAQADQTMALGWRASGQTTLIMGRANFETGDPGTPSALHFMVDGEQTRQAGKIPGISSTTGPVAAADYDADGDLDLFVGGSFKPAKFPEDASSRLFINENGRFRLDQTNARTLTDIGLVSGAVFSDFDSDGDPDLLVCRQWDSLLLLQNENGQFRDVSERFGLAASRGWWNGIATGDFNSDGRPDIVATNIGKNSIYQLQSPDKPLKLFYSDINIDGRLEIVDSYYDPKLEGYVPRRRLYSFDSVPGLLRTVQSHADFSRITVDQIFRQDASIIPSKAINTLQHMVFLNKENGFQPVPLPPYAQFSAAFHPAIADFDNDGNEDLFLSQNLFDLPERIPRIDAGRGVMLLGEGTGRFRVMKGQQSGITMYGEQRGAAVSDINNDGKADLVVAQNGGETKLYLNRSARRGIAIRLMGANSNTDAVGSSLRIAYEDGSLGPAREVQGGSGYRSQHSYTSVLGTEPGKSPVAVHVNWYDGSSERVPLDGTISLEIVKDQGTK